jgi:hypothetical protein
MVAPVYAKNGSYIYRPNVQASVHIFPEILRPPPSTMYILYGQRPTTDLPTIYS